MKDGEAVKAKGWRAVAAALLLGPHLLMHAYGESPGARQLLPVLPQVGDYTHMWWAEGFPAHAQGAPWRRVIQTGCYAFVLDTETMRVPHFGAVKSGVGYAACGRADNRAWQGLPPADLALTITANGKTYRCTAGGKWTQASGPRLIESGRCVQRGDVTDLVFESADGTRLNVEARFETVAWPDRLGLVFAARPGLQPIPAGEACFGRVGGGFGLCGTNHLEISPGDFVDPALFTLEFWAFLPANAKGSERTFPWLVCKNAHEQADGNYGVVLLGERLQARLNSGGRGGAVVVDARAGMMRVDAWNHLALAYDGHTLRFYVNGGRAGEQAVVRPRKPVPGALALGRRQDNCGDGYRFRGVLDEVRQYDRALTDEEVRNRYAHPEAALAGVKPVWQMSFRDDGESAWVQPREVWRSASLGIDLLAGCGRWRRSADGADAQSRHSAPDCRWREVFVDSDARAISDATERGAGAALKRLFRSAPEQLPPVEVRASEWASGAALPVAYEAARGWHAVTLDGIEPLLPASGGDRRNDALERVRVVLTNPAEREQPVRLLFEKTAGGFRQRMGMAITGVSAVLRDREGNPTGIPVQLSKNWHGRPDGGVYAGQWFRGFAFMRLRPRARVELELTLAYGHWGGVAAASHAQLCLIGWGSNQLWDQSALGSWGESICYEPDQAQAQAAILDVRPVMVRSMNNNAEWGWTHNVGGGDFFRLFGADGERVFPSRMRAAYERQGPCLTEVTYAGRLGEGIEHAATVSLGRTDDLVRGVYRLRMDVKKAVGFTRLVIFQIGADTYSYTGERKMALGNEDGLLREWETRWGGDVVRAGPLECVGRTPWVSLHEAVSRAAEKSVEKGEGAPEGAWANRGIVIRSWKARLGGKEAAPWLVERGASARGSDTSTADIVPPPGVARLEPGDFVEATFEHLIVPQFAADYYGPNEALRAALARDGNTWRMIWREAAGNDRRVEMKAGALEGLYPSVRVRAADGGAELTLAGGLGYVPVSFADLESPDGSRLLMDGVPVDQSVHGKDFWQSDYDPARRAWELTFTVPAKDGCARTLRLEKASKGHGK